LSFLRGGVPLNHLHKQSKTSKYEAIISPPLGSTSYKERLVYLYRQKSSNIKIISSYVYNGSVSKMFERQPFILHIKLSSSEQVIFIGVHLKPTNVYNEFRYLRTVIDEIKEKCSIILFGDFNADCSYLNNAKKKEIQKSYFNEFQWLIDDRTETNLLESCSYDRILVSSGINKWKKVNWVSKTNGTFQFDKKFKLTKQVALQISDHYPVEVDLY
jgi:deoxyribonuclease-1-like protein